MNPRKPKQKELAIAMRRQGYSYNEICEKLNIAKSTCSLWLSGVKLNKEAIHRLTDRQNEGRERGHLTLRQYAEERDAHIQQKVEKVIQRITITPEIGKLLCAALYWAEGSKEKSSVNFMNSDPQMIVVYMTLLRSYFDVDNKKFRGQLHLHSYHNIEKQKRYWSKITGIPMERIYIYRKANSGKNIKEGYPGCISIRYYDVILAKEIKFLYTSLVSKLGGVV